MFERKDIKIWDDVKAWWKGRKIKNDADLSLALNGNSVLLSYHSAKIENDRVTFNDTREIFDHDGVVSYTGDLRTLFEIRNSKEAYEFFLTAFGQKRAFDESLIKEFQRILTQNTYDERRWKLGERPGEYKKNDYVTGRNEIGASPEDTPAEMEELMEELADVNEDHILTAAAYFHAKFENIHPFADGNGRAGRLAMNYFMALHDYPVIIFHEEDRKDYYAALEAWDLKQELVPLKDFMKVQAVKTWGL